MAVRSPPVNRTLHTATLLLALLPAACAGEKGGAPGSSAKPGVVYIRPFAADRSVVTLDPGFGFTLAHGRVPERTRARSVGRAVQFILADELEEDLRRAGLPTTRLRQLPGTRLGGLPSFATRALVVGGRFEAIDEGAKRLGDRARPGQGASRVVAEIWVEYLAPGAAAQRLLTLHEDSNAGRDSEARAADANADAALVARRVADAIVRVARLKGWIAPTQ